MTVVLEPPEAAADRPRPRPVAADTPMQLSHVFADLLPDEVRARRRLARLKRRLAIAAGLLAVLLAAGYVLEWQQTGAARSAVASEQARTSSLNARLGSFSDLLHAQAQAQQIRSQLTGVMTDDLPWSKLINTLQRVAPPGVGVGALTGSVPGPDGSGAQAATTLDPNGGTVVGTLSVTGTAPDYRHIAAYVLALSHVPGLTDVNPASVAENTGTGAAALTFTVQIALTPDILGGRFAAPAAPTAPTAPTGGN